MMLKTLKHKNAIIVVLILICAVVVGLLMIGAIDFNQDIPHIAPNVSRPELSTIISETQPVPIVRILVPAPKMPENMMVYRLKRTISDEDFMKIASKLGISGEITKEARFIVIKNDSYQLDAGKTLGIINYQLMAPQQGYDSDFIEKFLPSDQSAKIIAEKFLNSNNLMPDEARFSKITHSEGYLTTDPPTKFSETINVEYLHEIAGFPVLTDQLTVKIGVKGEIINVFEKWVGHEPYHEYLIITPDEALNDLMNSGVVIPHGMDKPEKAEVYNMYLGYIGETQAEYFDYLIPVYVFEGDVYGDNKTEEFYQWIPALSNTKTQIEP